MDADLHGADGLPRGDDALGWEVFTEVALHGGDSIGSLAPRSLGRSSVGAGPGLTATDELESWEDRTWSCDGTVGVLPGSTGLPGSGGAGADHSIAQLQQVQGASGDLSQGEGPASLNASLAGEVVFSGGESMVSPSQKKGNTGTGHCAKGGPCCLEDGKAAGSSEATGLLCTSVEALVANVSCEAKHEPAPGGDSSVGSDPGKGAQGGREESWVCAICHNVIPLAQTARVKGCDHHYCANCILQWCSYKTYPWCPQCRTPFSSLVLFKLLDGSLSDSMVEESVCLLLRAPWYVPVEIAEEAEAEEEVPYDEDDYDEEEYYRTNLRLGNRRWGENGYVRGGRMQARVATAQGSSTPSPSAQRGSSARTSASGSSSAAKSGSEESGGMGRRAKRTQKREQADKEETAPLPRSGRQQQRERQRQARGKPLHVA